VAPWPEDNQIEQDLILSRLMIEIANHDLLGGELAMRGGTCLHKLHLPAPLRYSEDLDYVRRTKSGIGPVLDALREIATAIGLEDGGSDFRGPMVHARFDAAPTSGVGLIRVKVEVNIVETDPLLRRVALPLSVRSPWWGGDAEISTFAVEELLGTKLRALYQRSKGRDLFDLWLALNEVDVDGEKVIDALGHYMGENAFTFPELRANLQAKLCDRDFAADPAQLARALPEGFAPETAADTVMERLGQYLRDAPPQDRIRNGVWRD
jgi:predicted nucleotidyltransferase component of viral defense system